MVASGVCGNQRLTSRWAVLPSEAQVPRFPAITIETFARPGFAGVTGMDDRRFDAFIRALDSGSSRRTVMRGLLGLGVGAATASVASERASAARRGFAGPTFPTPKPTAPRRPAPKTGTRAEPAAAAAIAAREPASSTAPAAPMPIAPPGVSAPSRRAAPITSAQSPSTQAAVSTARVARSRSSAIAFLSASQVPRPRSGPASMRFADLILKVALKSVQARTPARAKSS